LVNSGTVTLNHQSGIFSAPGGLTIQLGTYALNGGTIANTTITLSGGALTFSGSANNLLSGVAINGNVTLGKTRVWGGLTLNGTATLGITGSSISFEGSQSLNSGIIRGTNVGGGAFRTLNVNAGDTLTIAPGASLR